MLVQPTLLQAGSPWPWGVRTLSPGDKQLTRQSGRARRVGWLPLREERADSGCRLSVGLLRVGWVRGPRVRSDGRAGKQACVVEVSAGAYATFLYASIQCFAWHAGPDPVNPLHAIQVWTGGPARADIGLPEGAQHRVGCAAGVERGVSPAEGPDKWLVSSCSGVIQRVPFNSERCRVGVIPRLAQN